MLFNSYVFILLFLPLTVILFHLCRHLGYSRLAVFVLILASLIFYGFWSIKYLFLLLSLTLINFCMAKAIIAARKKNSQSAKLFLILGIILNLSILAYYKYANFFVDNVNQLLAANITLAYIILPIGISFFTFQKIAFLKDIYDNKVSKLNFMNFLLFVTFFPQLIAGPIVHHSEIMPQLTNLKKVTPRFFLKGITFLTIGLAKKVLLADTAAKFASPAFNAVAGGQHLDFLAAWSAALAYAVQLYFDFSAYSDMAIGMALFFGIYLPINFNSPYKSSSIIEFWRRWHITLSRFLRDYLYIPLGGNRKGPTRRYINLYLTMLLGGIWHGAGWTFVIWGALHGIYLIINHKWHELNSALVIKIRKSTPKVVATILTFLAVVIAWIFFRAANVHTAFDILKSMGGGYGFALPPSFASLGIPLPVSTSPVDSGLGLLVALILLVLTWTAPNTQQLTSYIGPQGVHNKEVQKISYQLSFRWKPSLPWAIATGCLFALCLMMFTQVSEFIYFQF